MGKRLKRSCDDEHRPWPASSHDTRHTSEDATAQRVRAFESDLVAFARDEDARSPRQRPALLDDGDLIDPATGEVPLLERLANRPPCNVCPVVGRDAFRHQGVACGEGAAVVVGATVVDAVLGVGASTPV